MKRNLLASAGLAILGCMMSLAPARAANVGVISVDRSGLALIGVSGELEAEDGKAFASVARRYQRAVVAFNSPGGALIAGLQMGQIIRLKHFATFSPQGTYCASACAIAWLAGGPRFMQPASRIGFHAAFDPDTHEQTGVGNALVGAYLNRLGLSDAAIVYIEQARPDEITWLTPTDARRLGIDITLIAPTPEQEREQRSGGRTVSRPREDAPRRPELLPSLAVPVTPATKEQPDSLDQRASVFAEDYFAHWSEANSQALGFFVTAYAPKVIFYGQPIARPVLMEQKREYANRWPVRVYSNRRSSTRTFCNAVNRTCVVTGIVDWDCRNAERGTRSTGAANFSLTVSFADGAGQIMTESGSVIIRQIN